MFKPMQVLCILFYLMLKSKAVCEECETTISSLETRIDALEQKEGVHLDLIRNLNEAVQQIQEERNSLLQNIKDLEITVKEQGKLINTLEKQKHEDINSYHPMITMSDKIFHKMKSINKVKRSVKSDTASNTAQLDMARQSIANTSRVVAFHATIDSNQNWPYAVSHLTIGQAIVFDSVKLNVGQGYHSSTGLFIAPVAGLYMFSSSVMTKGEIQLNIVKNGEPLTGMFATNRQGSVTIAVQLQVSDEVLIKVQSPNDAYIWGDRLASFTGCLISTT